MRKRWLIFLLLIALLPAVRPAAAHIPLEFDSIHFNSGEPDFGIPPRRAIVYHRGEIDDRPLRGDWGPSYGERTGVELSEERDAAAQANRMRRVSRSYAAALRYASAGRWRQCRGAYLAIVDELGWSGALRDRVELIDDSTGANERRSLSDVVAYLRAMDLSDHRKWAAARSAFQQLAGSTNAVIRRHARYQLASIDYQTYHFSAAAREYRQVLGEFAAKPKRSAILLMIARCDLLQRHPTAQDVAAGNQALAEVVAIRPPAYFRRAVLGLQARIAFLEKRYADAVPQYERLNDLASLEKTLNAMRADNPAARTFLLAGYLKQIDQAGTYAEYDDAASSVDRCRREMTIADARAFAAYLRRNAEIAAPYFYYRLYLLPVDSHSLSRLSKLADDLTNRYPGLSLPESVCVKVAEVYYQNGDPRKALRWADRALEHRTSARALYVRGASLHALHRYRSAIVVFGQLVDNYPSSPLCRAAHEELALLWETRGRLDRALDEYYILGYKPDIAFFLDARMSTDEVRDYLRGHWHSPRRRELMHALALRCMRDERWEEAKRLLRTLPKTAYAAYNPHPDDWWLDKPSPDPLHALSDLSRLQAAIGRARSQQSRAAAMYAYASYYYSHGTLLLYNAQLWQGDRAAAFAWWWNTRHATKQDTLLAHKHMYDHEVYARCMRICQEIARRYPRSSEAPMAMYRTACCMERLANFNDWWRQENTNARLLKKAIHWMKQVYIQYPHDRLAPSARKYAAVFADEALQRY